MWHVYLLSPLEWSPLVEQKSFRSLGKVIFRIHAVVGKFRMSKRLVSMPKISMHKIWTNVCLSWNTHQGLHVIHCTKVVPDDFRRYLSANILTELVPNTYHVKVPVHTCITYMISNSSDKNMWLDMTLTDYKWQISEKPILYPVLLR